VSRKKPSTPPATLPLTSEVARRQAQAEKLTLLRADNKSGYFGVLLGKPGQPKPYQVQVWRGGKRVPLGSFATAGEAALCVARSPEGQAEAAKRAAAAAPLTSEVARQQAQAEKLTLLVAANKTGYFGVVLGRPGQHKPYQARAWRGRWQGRAPGLLCHRRGGGAVRRALARGAGGGGGTGGGGGGPGLDLTRDFALVGQVANVHV